MMLLKKYLFLSEFLCKIKVHDKVSGCIRFYCPDTPGNTVRIIRNTHVRLSPKGKEIYALRGETIERVFADAKEKHGMRYTLMRGLEKQRLKALLTFAYMNLKKLAKWKLKNGLLPPFINQIRKFLYQIKKGVGVFNVPAPFLSTV
jgi:hypothetical protein